MSHPATHKGMIMLQRQTVMDWMLKVLQGTFVATGFLPDTTVMNTSFKWFQRGNIGGMTPPVGENDMGPMHKTRYRQQSGLTKDYRERTGIGTRVNHESIAWGDVARDNINELTERGGLRLEYLRLSAIISNADNANARKGITWEDLDEGGRNWVGGAAGNSIYSDIINGQTKVWKYAHRPTDTLLGSPEVGQAMRDNIEGERWDRKGPLSVMHAREGDAGSNIRLLEANEENGRAQANLGKVAGHEVFISSAYILTNNDDDDSALSPIIDKDVYIFKRGEKLGRTVFFEKPQFRSKPPDQFSDTQEWQFRMSLVPIIYRRNLIFTYRNAVV